MHTSFQIRGDPDGARQTREASLAVTSCLSQGRPEIPLSRTKGRVARSGLFALKTERRLRRWLGRLKVLTAKPDNLNWRELVPTQLSSDLHKHAMRLVLPTRTQNKNSGVCVKG